MASSQYWTAGKSIRAQRAEANGLMTASALAAWAKQFKRFAGCMAADVANAMTPEEWHHTSKMFNATNYYNAAELLSIETREALAAEIQERKRAAKIWKRALAECVTGGKDAVVIHMPDSDEVWHTVTEKTSRQYVDRLESELARK